MTEQQQLAEAAAAAKAATISVDDWLRNIRTKPSYRYQNSWWYHAAKQLDQIRHLPPPRPQPSDVTAVGRAWLITAQNPAEALHAPAYYGLAVTADRAYTGQAQAIAAAKLQGRRTAVWCDCDATPASAAIDMARTLGCDLWIGQCETPGQFDHAVAAGGRLLVGNLSALRDDQLALVKAGKVVVINELYRNLQPDQQPDWRNANAGVAGNCVACYGGYPFRRYLDDRLFIRLRDSVYAVDLTDDDWKVLQ